MSAIISSAGIIPKSGYGAGIRLNFNPDAIIKQYEQQYNAVLTLSKKDELLKKLAQQVIMCAYWDDLIPSKAEYQLKNRKLVKLRDKEGNYVYSKDKDGNIKRDANGNKIHRYEKFSPSQYYYYTKDTLNYANMNNTTTQEKYSYQTRTVTHVTGSVVNGYKSATKRTRTPWTEVEGNPTYGKSYVTDRIERTVNRKDKKTGKVTQHKCTTTKYYSDRPPHLIDEDSNGIPKSHKIAIKNHMAGISISIKKPKDPKFINEGGVDYGLIQYYGSDANWKRADEGATSMWLHVAMGLPTMGAIKGSSRVDVNANMKSLENVAKLYIAQNIKKKR